MIYNECCSTMNNAELLGHAFHGSTSVYPLKRRAEKELLQYYMTDV